MISSGEMEPTMLRSFIWAGRLRRWLTRTDCPPAIRECKHLLDRAYSSKSDDHEGPSNTGETFVEESRDWFAAESNPQVVPEDLFRLIKKRKTILRACVIYAKSSTHFGNSLVQFYPDGQRTLPPIPGCIAHIFVQEGRVSFAVRQYLPVHDNTVDPFQHYPHFLAKLYSSDLAPELEIVEIEWVMSHFAQWSISTKHVVIVSLSRVRLKVHSNFTSQVLIDHVGLTTA